MALTRDDAASATTSPAETRPEPPASRRRVSPEVVALIAVGVIGLVARFVARSPLWLDEALSVNIAGLPLGEIPEALRHDGHPPLYYFLLHGWIRAVGTGDVAVRLLSGILGVGAVVLVWFAARRAAGDRAAWGAALIAAISPFAVRYSTEARMYSLVMVLVAGGYLLVRRALDEPRLGRLALVGGVSGLLLLTHYWALWLVGGTVLTLAWLAARSTSRPARVAGWRTAGAVAGGGILLLPWLPSLVYQAMHTGTPWAGPVRPTVIVQTGLVDFGSAVTGTAVAEAGLAAIVLALLVGIGVFGRPIDDTTRLELDVRTVPDVRREAFVVGVTIALAALAEWVTGTTFASRYLAVVFPLVAIVAGAGLAKVPGRPARFVVAGVLVGLCLVGVGINAWAPRTQAGEVAGAIERDAQAGDGVVFCPDQLGPAVSRELPQDLVQIVYPSLSGPERVDWVDYVDRYESADAGAVADEVVERVGPGRRVWLVTGGSYDVSDECAAFINALTTRLGGGAVVVVEEPEVFEPAALIRFDVTG